MDQEKIIQLKQGLSTAFINQNTSSNLAYKPQFVSNNYKEGRKVITSIEDELLSCEEFAISVAFITKGGITPLLQTLRELEMDNLIHREMYPQVPPKVEYSLTETGKELIPFIKYLVNWGYKKMAEENEN